MVREHHFQHAPRTSIHDELLAMDEAERSREEIDPRAERRRLAYADYLQLIKAHAAGESIDVTELRQVLRNAELEYSRFDADLFILTRFAQARQKAERLPNLIGEADKVRNSTSDREYWRKDAFHVGTRLEELKSSIAHARDELRICIRYGDEYRDLFDDDALSFVNESRHLVESAEAVQSWGPLEFGVAGSICAR